MSALIPTRSTTVSAATGINHQINFQGKLVTPTGTNVTDGSYSIVFSLYNVSSGGAAIWTETQNPTVTNGIFQVSLGSVTALPGSVDFNTDNIYLGIKVGADAEMTPRIQFTSVPQAFNSEKLGGLDKTGFIQNQTAVTQTADFKISGAGTIGTSLTTPLIQNAGNLTMAATGANQLLFQTNGSTRLTIDSSGNATFTGTLTVSSTSNSIFGNGTTGGIQIGDGTITKTSGSGFAFNSTVNSTTGFQIGSTASTGSYLRGNGTNFVSGTIQAADIPTGSGNYIQNQTASPQSAGFNVNGNGSIGGTLGVTGLATLNGGATIYGTTSLYGATQHYNFSNVIAGTAGWFKMGTLALPQNGYNATIGLYAGVGYNANDSQISSAQIHIRTSNGSSTNASGFGASGTVSQNGNSSGFSQVKLVANAAGVAATSYDVYVYSATFVGAGFYTVDSNGGNWTNTMNAASDPGVNSTTVYALPYSFNSMGQLTVTSTSASVAGQLNVGSSSQFQVSNTGVVTGGTYNGQTISSAANLTGTLNVATSIATAGTTRLDASGNLSNIGTITSGLINGQTISSSANFTGSLAVASNTSIAGRRLQLSNFYDEYRWMFGGAQDQNWKTIANISEGTGLYTGVSFQVDMLNSGTNFGASSNAAPMRYYVSATRSGGTQDDTNGGSVAGPIADYVRLVKTGLGVYELQVHQPADWLHLATTARVISQSGSTTVTYVDSPANGSTTGTNYMPNIAGYTENLPNVAAGGSLTATGVTNVNGGLSQGGFNILNGTDTWLRTNGSTGWYSQTYSGGIYMTDSSYVRTYNSKPIAANGFYDQSNTAYYLLPANTSSINILNTAGAINGQTISSSANFTGTLVVASSVTAASFSGAGTGLTGTASSLTSGATNAVNSPDGDRNASTKLPTTRANGVRYDFANASTTGTGGNYAGVMTYAPWDGTTGSTGDASYQLAYGSTAANGGGIPQLNIRKGIDSTWNSWYTILHSGNFNSYAPTLNGTGASGTWAINITGSAPAVSLTGTTLAAGVTTSSLTSVGTLGTLTVSGAITSGLINGQTISSSANFTGTLTAASTLKSAGEVQSTASNAFRMVQGNFGSFFRNDGSDTYLLLTASADQYGSWNALRPIQVNDTSGTVYFGAQALTVQNGANVGIGNASPNYKLDVNGTASAITFNSTQTTGTAPFTVASTTKVTNLNADLLDGLDSTAFGDATAANQTTILNRIGTNADAAGTSTLFARLARIDDTDLGATADAANSSGTIFARLTDLLNRVSTLNTNVGSDADAASATGSVHAKLKDIKASISAGSGKTQYTQTFTSNGTWTKPAGVGVVDVYVVGGGGGGNMSGYNYSCGCYTGGGGAGGGGAVIHQPVSVSGNVSVTIGAGGAGNASYSDASRGSSSSFGSLVAPGGYGGTNYGGANGPNGMGGANGLNIYTNSGNTGLVTITNGSSDTSGSGFGVGGIGSSATPVVGAANTGNGGGGGTSSGFVAGVAGGSGIVIVTWWQ